MIVIKGRTSQEIKTRKPTIKTKTPAINPEIIKKERRKAPIILETKLEEKTSM